MKHPYFFEHENTLMFSRKCKLSALYPIWGQIRISSIWIKENKEKRFELICWTETASHRMIQGSIRREFQQKKQLRKSLILHGLLFTSLSVFDKSQTK